MTRMLFNYNDVLVEETQSPLEFGEIHAQKDLESFKKNLIESFNDDSIFKQRTHKTLERVESRGSKGESTKDSLKFPNSVRLADSFKDLVDICDYSEPTDAVELKQLARERRL